MEVMRAQTARRVAALKGGTENSEHSAAVFLVSREQIRQSMLEAEREELARLRSDKQLSGEVFKSLTKELDMREQAIRTGNAQR